MKLISSLEDDMRGLASYELGDGRRICFDANAVRDHGLGELLRASGLGEFVPTKRLAVIQHGRQVGTMSPDFEPNSIRSVSPFYDPRPGDFRREGDVWIARRTLGPGDLEAIQGFSRSPETASVRTHETPASDLAGA
jgi:hypothetical protein